MASYPSGTRVRITLEGSVAEQLSHDGCHKVIDTEGWNHYIFMSGAAAIIDVLDPVRNYKRGQVYQVTRSDGSSMIGPGIWIVTSESSPALTLTSDANVKYTTTRFDDFVRRNKYKVKLLHDPK